MKLIKYLVVLMALLYFFQKTGKADSGISDSRKTINPNDSIGHKQYKVIGYDLFYGSIGEYLPFDVPFILSGVLPNNVNRIKLIYVSNSLIDREFRKTVDSTIINIGDLIRHINEKKPLGIYQTIDYASNSYKKKLWGLVDWKRKSHLLKTNSDKVDSFNLHISPLKANTTYTFFVEFEYNLTKFSSIDTIVVSSIDRNVNSRNDTIQDIFTINSNEILDEQMKRMTLLYNGTNSFSDRKRIDSIDLRIDTLIQDKNDTFSELARKIIKSIENELYDYLSAKYSLEVRNKDLLKFLINEKRMNEYLQAKYQYWLSVEKINYELTEEDFKAFEEDWEPRFGGYQFWRTADALKLILLSQKKTLLLKQFDSILLLSNWKDEDRIYFLGRSKLGDYKNTLGKVSKSTTSQDINLYIDNLESILLQVINVRDSLEKFCFTHNCTEGNKNRLIDVAKRLDKYAWDIKRQLRKFSDLKEQKIELENFWYDILKDSHKKYTVSEGISSGFVHTTTNDFITRSEYYISADLGLAALSFGNSEDGRGIKTIQPYFGVNFNLFPINRQAHYNLLTSGWKVFKGASLNLGVTSRDVALDLEDGNSHTGEVKGLWARSNISPMLLTGIGFRISDYSRLTLGANWFRYRSSNSPTAQQNYKLGTSPYISISLDWDVKKTIKPIFDTIFKSSGKLIPKT